MNVIILSLRGTVAAGFSLRTLKGAATACVVGTSLLVQMTKQSHNIIIFLLTIFLLPSVVSWHNAPQAAEQQPLVIEPFIYEGAKYRDPFLSPFDSGAVKSQSKFLLGGLHLKGILRTSKGLDYAIIVSETGNRYILVGQRLYDDYDKVVPNVQGYVRENTVILKSGNQIKELLTEEKR